MTQIHYIVTVSFLKKVGCAKIFLFFLHIFLNALIFRLCGCFLFVNQRAVCKIYFFTVQFCDDCTADGGVADEVYGCLYLRLHRAGLELSGSQIFFFHE